MQRILLNIIINFYIFDGNHYLLGTYVICIMIINLYFANHHHGAYLYHEL